MRIIFSEYYVEMIDCIIKIAVLVTCREVNDVNIHQIQC